MNTSWVLILGRGYWWRHAPPDEKAVGILFAFGIIGVICLLGLFFPGAFRVFSRSEDDFFDGIASWVEGKSKQGRFKRGIIGGAITMGFCGVIFLLTIFFTFGSLDSFTYNLKKGLGLIEDAPTSDFVMGVPQPTPAPVPTAGPDWQPSQEDHAKYASVNFDEIDSLLKQASNLWRAGMKSEAMMMAERAKVLCEQRLPPDHPKRAQVEAMINAAKQK